MLSRDCTAPGALIDNCTAFSKSYTRNQHLVSRAHSRGCRAAPFQLHHCRDLRRGEVCTVKSSLDLNFATLQRRKLLAALGITAAAETQVREISAPFSETIFGPARLFIWQLYAARVYPSFKKQAQQKSRCPCLPSTLAPDPSELRGCQS